MRLRRETADEIVEEINNFLRRGYLAYVALNETKGYIDNFSTAGKLTEPAQAKEFEGEITIRFSACDFSFTVWEDNDVQRDGGLKIRYTAPNGDRRLD